ncbi:glycosyl transferase family 2 [Thermodesulfomicrobium sp. WS]|uniref:glycosyltransferase family 2 protein n=1 Tax=Thermodesulfomicrobium sp. WS TaxID=3004129 RepID=UPI00249169B6|nr:glycosyltransferase [Thermodesulfomicrobium sp. WS]BDV00013.1 glycosyl transferase family 2 [Thermodesulfomicrobium sp. WS]
MGKPRVSVVLPCYQAEDTLPACLESLLAQTLGDLEVIAVDDGSRDATAEVLRRYARWDTRVRPFFRPHEGFVATVNFGLAQSQGEFVARMDADDVCLPARLAEQAHFLDAHPHIGLVGCLVRFGGDAVRARGYQAYVEWTNSVVDEESISRSRFIESPFAHPSLMWRRPLVSRLGGFYEGPFPEDYEPILRWLDAGVRMAKVPQELLVWNDPPTRLSRTDPRYDSEAFYAIKARYLARWLHSQGHERVAVVGAGRLSRRRALLLEAHGVEIRYFLDVDPAKIGKTLAGKPVFSWYAMESAGQDFLVSYVGGRGGRERVAAFLERRGYEAGRHYILAA